MMNNSTLTNMTDMSYSLVNLTEIRIPISKSVYTINASLASFGVGALVFNVLIIIALVKYAGGLGGNSINAQLIALTINDILSSLGVCFSICYSVPLFHYNRHLCISIIVYLYVAQTSSVVILALIGVQRLIRVLNMRKKHSSVSNRSSIVIVTAVPVIWLSCCLLYIGLYLAMAEMEPRIPECTTAVGVGVNAKRFNTISAYLNFITLLLVNCLYLTIFIKLKMELLQKSGRWLFCYMCKPGDAVTMKSNHDPVFSIKSALTDTFDEIYNTVSQTRPEQRTFPVETIHGSSGIQPSTSTVTMTTTSVVSAASTASKDDTPPKRNLTAVEINRRKHSIRALVTVSLVLIAANLAMAPTVVLRIVRTMLSVPVDFRVAAMLNVCVSIINSLFNPFVYCLRIREIRKAVKNMLMTFCK